MDGRHPPHGTLPLHLIAGLRFLATGRPVFVWGADALPCRAALPEAEKVIPAEPRQFVTGALLLCPDPDLAEQFLSGMDLHTALASGMIAAVWSLAELQMPQGAACTAHYLHRLVTGALLRDTQIGPGRVAMLHGADQAEAHDLHLWLLAAHPIPPLRPGFYEGGVYPAPPQLQPPPHAKWSLPRPDGRAAELAGRLLEVEQRTMHLRAKILQLEARLSDGGGSPSGGASFDVPRTRHPWPLAEAERPSVPISLYDRRPDDAVLDEARRGAAFMEQHGLLGQAPDFAGAVAALNETEQVLGLDADQPDVSIVIPVYGQLPYTLNCLDSLRRHVSRYTAEIIVLDDCSPDGVTAEFVPQVTNVRYHRQAVNGGFIQSCNTGGKLARGAHVLMLNSDTRVVAGWLDEILDSFALFPKAGLVGSKMLYPDGTLQEAGGILWRDGSAWNYGRDDDPNRPQYCFARQVDYISGCSIAMPTSLWREFGGFDPHYTPAYAEDADLCQRIAARGLEVWYQPRSRVVHYEGKTSGTSVGSGVKAYQVINLRKLFLRWRRRFEDHRRNADAPFFEKERRVRKRILFVDAVTPTPDQDAGSVQTVLGLRCSQAAGYKACFVPEDNWLFEPDYTARLQREGVECAYAPFELGFENYIRRYGWLFDAVVVYRVHVMEKCLPLLREYAPGAVALFHLADLHYLRMQRQAELEGDEGLAQMAAAMKERELETIRLSDCTITHSTVEAEILAEGVPDAPVTVWPLMMELVGTRVGYDARRDLCFLGGYRHPPNVDAMLWFVGEVLPLIHAVRPELRLVIAGANPTAEVLDLACDRVVVTGMVADLAEVFDSARIFVCPLRVGAGAKGKVMSAMAHGLPIVSTPVGVEGAGLTEGEHVLVAQEAATFARTVLRLYDDPALWRDMSEAGLALIRENFSLQMGVSKLEEALEKASRNRLGLLDA